MTYELPRDPYTAPVTGVMHNLLGLKDLAELDEAERTEVAVATAASLQKLTPTVWDASLLCLLHRRLFGGIYAWAGTYRTVEISKGTSRFAAAAYIAGQTDAVLAELNDEVAAWRQGDERTPRRIAHYYSELNAIHPFREGNGRTIRLFLSLLALQYGWYLDWSKTTAAENLQACAEAFYGDEARLTALMVTVAVRANEGA